MKKNGRPIEAHHRDGRGPVLDDVMKRRHGMEGDLRVLLKWGSGAEPVDKAMLRHDAEEEVEEAWDYGLADTDKVVSRHDAAEEEAAAADSVLADVDKVVLQHGAGAEEEAAVGNVLAEANSASARLRLGQPAAGTSTVVFHALCQLGR